MDVQAPQQQHECNLVFSSESFRKQGKHHRSSHRKCDECSTTADVNNDFHDEVRVWS
jgi:hypothetical protein